MADYPDYPFDAERPFRFPPLQGERFEAEREAARAARPHAETRKHGIFADKVERHEDGSLSEVYGDGYVEHYSAEEVKEFERQRAAREADELLIHGPPAQTMAEAISIETVSVPWDVPSLAQEETLVGAATLLDHLDDLGDDACEELCRLLNDYGAGRWGMLPLFEVYRTPEDSPWETKRVLGYRLNSFEAVIVPDKARDLDSDEEDASTPWSTDVGLSELDRITEVLTDTSDEMIHGPSLLCERGPTMGFHLVRNGRVYGKRDWTPLYRALEEGKGQLWRAVPDYVTPLLVDSGFGAAATTVAALVEAAKATMYRDEEERQREGDDLLSDEILAAMERLSSGDALRYWQLERIRRRQQGRNRVHEVWAALKECAAHGRALLPSWDHPESHDELILLCQSYEALDEQLRAYASSHPELELTGPKREYPGFFGARDADKEAPEPADPAIGHYVFSAFARETWEDPRYWWARSNRAEVDAVRGQWVALDQFYNVLASGGDPEALKEGEGWFWIVSVPEEGFSEGLLITNPTAAVIED